MRWQAAVIILALFPGGATAAGAEACRSDRAVFLGGPAPIAVPVEIADDAQERARGLMFRRELTPGTGMLFIYEHPQQVSFWMRNTLIPLDMIFVDPRGEVRHVHPMARPLDETSIPGAAVGDPAPQRLMVLELPGGDAERLGIRPGMALAHPALPQATAIAPCG